MAQKEVETGIDSLTLYLDGGAVHRSKDLRLKEGKNELRFVGLSPKLRAGSIRLSLSRPERARILSVSDHTNMLTHPEEGQKVEELRSELERKKIKKDSLRDVRNAYEEQKQMLLSNKDIGGEGENVSSTEMQQMADLFQERIQRINRKHSALSRKVRSLEKRRRKLRRQLRELNAKANYRSSELEVLIVADAPMELEVGLNYRVDGAGWAPFYDVRAKGVDRPVNLSYRAKVFNDTEVDWKNVKLTLSTGSAERDVSKPDLEKWSLSYYQKRRNYRKGGLNLQQKKASKGSQKREQQGKQKTQALDEEEAKGQEEVQFKEVQVSEMSPDFRIEDSYSIPSDAKPYIVEVTDYELPATYKHYTVPKMEESVFLLAGVTDWENLGLIEGKANVYFDGDYKGNSYLKPRGLGDPLRIR